MVKKQSEKKDTAELENRLLRSLADYQNLLKRVDKEKEEIRLRACKGLVEDLLPVLDSLERARVYLKDDGLQMALDSFYKALANTGLEKIKVSVQDKFDESLHEVLELVPGGEKNRVAEVTRDGYIWNDGMVLRPAQVKVYGGK